MKIRSIIFTSILLSILTSPCKAVSQLHITTGFTPPVSSFYDSVLKEADKRLADISISFETLPAERSLIMVNQGFNDGDCCRIPSVLTAEYKNLTAIDESFFSARFSAFGKSQSIEINKFEDLKPFAVGTVVGWKIAVIKVKEISPASVHIVTTPEQLFRMLERDRLDYGVVGYLSGLETLTRLNIKNIHAIQPPLIEKQLYLVLHNKHKDLIPVFNQVLKDMKNDGTINKLYSELINSLK